MGLRVLLFRIAKWTFMITAIAANAACAGTVVVDFAIGAQVIRRDHAGNTLSDRAEIVVLPRHPKLLSPFSAVQYRGEALEWVFGTGTLGLGGKLTNRSGSELCLRFDEALVASNARVEAKPLLISHWVRYGDRPPARLGHNRPEDRSYFVPPVLCIEPSKSTNISFSPDLRELFPNQKMFGVMWRDNEPELTERGIGNWIRMWLPLERDGKRESLEIVLTARDSSARTSSY